MTQYRTIAVDEVERLRPAIVSAVEQRSDYGKRRPDWHTVLADVENSESDLDLGSDMRSPVVLAILEIAKEVYRGLAAEK